MKKLIVCIAVLFSLTGLAFAEGGKVQGEGGIGETTTGTTAVGAAEQDRTGR